MFIDKKYSNQKKDLSVRTTLSRSTSLRMKRKSPQRVSFTKTKPKVYERTPESSLSDDHRGMGGGMIRYGEIHTVV